VRSAEVPDLDDLNAAERARSRWYWEASAENFRGTESTAILGQLVAHHRFDVDAKQRGAWLHEIEDLKLLASAVSRSHFFIEFSIPRMGKRADAISSRRRLRRCSRDDLLRRRKDLIFAHIIC
jgi:hypothetical protein